MGFFQHISLLPPFAMPGEMKREIIAYSSATSLVFLLASAVCSVLYRTARQQRARREQKMRRINPAYMAAARETANQSPYFRLLSMELKQFEIGSSLVEISLRQDHLQPFGVVHGGVFSSIIDAAAFWAVFSEIPEGLGMTTVDLKLNYLAPAISGKMIATGRSIKVGKTLGLGEAQVRDHEGRVLAHGMSTLIVIPEMTFDEKNSMPPKFLED